MLRTICDRLDIVQPGRKFGGHSVASRAGRTALGLGLAALLLLPSAGCQGFTSQGRNAEGVRYFQQGSYENALREFQEASYVDPDNADSYYNLAATYHRTGRVYNRPSDLKQAEDLYNQCLDHRPDHRDCYRGLAVLLAEEGRTEEAFRLLQGWVDRQPGNADARIELARLYDEAGERNAAKTQLIDALNADPNNSRALAAIGHIREQMGETQQALAAYQQSYAQDPRQNELATRIATLQGLRGAVPTGADTNIAWGNAPPAGNWR